MPNESIDDAQLGYVRKSLIAAAKQIEMRYINFPVTTATREAEFIYRERVYW